MSGLTVALSCPTVLRIRMNLVRRTPLNGAWLQALKNKSQIATVDLPEPTGPISPLMNLRESRNDCPIGPALKFSTLT